MAKGTTYSRPQAKRFRATAISQIYMGIFGGRCKRLLFFLGCLVTMYTMADATERGFDLNIPASNADIALKRLSHQTGYSVIFKSVEVEHIKTNSLVGHYTLTAALRALFRGTILSGGLTKSGIITVSQKLPGESGGEQMANKKTKRSLYAGVAALLTSALGLTDVAGQDAGNGPDTNVLVLEEVIVTARKREENLMDTPISITAFTAEDLSNRQIERINQIAEASPNVVFRTHANASANNNNAIVYIRGIGQDDYIPTVEPGVGIYLDNAYIAQTTGAVLDVVDVESIQVLRGPQGTLFGRNTIGGAVLINTNKPNDEFRGNLEFIAGSYDHLQGKGSINIPLTDNFFAKGSFLARHKDGYVDLPLIDDDDGGGSDDTQAGRLALRWLPSSNLTIDASVDYTGSKSDARPSVLEGPIDEFNPATDAGAYNVIIAPLADFTPLYTNAFFNPPEDRSSNATRHIRSDSDIWGISLNISWDVAGLNIKSLTNYRNIELDDQRDSDHSPADVVTIGDVLDSEQFSQELQVSGQSFKERLKWLTGLYYFEEENFNVNDVTFPFFGVISGSITDNTSLALFFQGTYEITERLSLTAGLRYTKEDKDFIVDDRIQYLVRVFNPPSPGAFINFPPQAVKVVPNGVSEADETELDPHVNLTYRWNDDFMTYFSYSEGFKGGGFVQRVQPGQMVTNFGPEFATVYEVGFKWDGFDRHLKLTGAGFFTDYEDLQITVQRQIAPVKENAGDAEIYGAELEMTIVPMDRWLISAGIGYLDAEYTELAPQATIAVTNELPSIPEWQLNTSVSYMLPVPTLSGTLVTRFDWSWSDEYALAADNLVFRDDLHLLNASLVYQHDSERWEVAFLGRNITDEFYITTPGGNLATAGYREVTVGQPGEWGIKFNYRF